MFVVETDLECPYSDRQMIRQISYRVSLSGTSFSACRSIRLETTPHQEGVNLNVRCTNLSQNRQ